MAATGKTPILLYGSTTPTNAPVAGNLTNSSDGCELAVNVADGKLFYKNSSNVISQFGITLGATAQPLGSTVSAINAVSIGASTPSTGNFTAATVTGSVGTASLLSTGAHLTFSRASINYVNASTAGGYLSFGTSGNNGQMIIDTTGRVGINKTPGQALDVTYAASTILNTSSTGTNQATVNNVNTGGTLYSGINDSAAGYITSAPAYSAMQWYSGNYPMVFATNNTKRLSIEAAGDVTVSTGNLVIGTSGKGIDFSATSDGTGTATSELLADYEEGTFTPVLRFGGAAVGMTGTFTGNYTKVGRAVFVYGRIVLTAKGSSTGNMSIIGLPYTSIDASSGIADPSTGMAGLTAGGAIPMGISSTTVYMFLQTTTSRNLLTDANFTNTSDVRFSLVYNT